MRDDEIGVVGGEVDRGRGEHHPGQATHQEGEQETDREQHRSLERDLSSPHRPDPVEEFDPGRNGDEQRQKREERKEHRAGREHVVRPDTRSTAPRCAIVANTMPL